MKVNAKLNYLRIAPRKVRLIVDLIRGKKAEEAKIILGFTIKKGSSSVLKLLNQAIANAKNNFQLDPANLFVAEIKVDEGPKLKRWRARARGQAYEIQKKTSHISLTLDEMVKGKIKKKKIVKGKVNAEEGGVPEQKTERMKKKEKPKFKPETQIAKPKVEKGLKRIFRRKAF